MAQSLGSMRRRSRGSQDKWHFPMSLSVPFRARRSPMNLSRSRSLETANAPPERDEKGMTLDEPSSPNTPKHAPAEGPPFGHVHVKISKRNRTIRNLAVWMVPNTDRGSQSSRGGTAAFRGMLTGSATIGHADDVVAPSGRFGPRYGIARGSANKRRDTSDL